MDFRSCRYSKKDDFEVEGSVSTEVGFVISMFEIRPRMRHLYLLRGLSQVTAPNNAISTIQLIDFIFRPESKK